MTSSGHGKPVWIPAPSHNSRGSRPAPSARDNPRRIRQQPLPLGQIVATPGVLGALAAAGEDPAAFLRRDPRGDCGNLDEHDRAVNRQALLNGARVLSAYTLVTGEKLWVITESDRSVTTLLLPEGYRGGERTALGDPTNYLEGIWSLPSNISDYPCVACRAYGSPSVQHELRRRDPADLRQWRATPFLRDAEWQDGDGFPEARQPGTDAPDAQDRAQRRWGKRYGSRNGARGLTGRHQLHRSADPCGAQNPQVERHRTVVHSHLPAALHHRPQAGARIELALVEATRYPVDPTRKVACVGSTQGMSLAIIGVLPSSW